jgi:four helix bundle protein
MERQCMDKIISHKDLIVWQKAITLACKVYAVSAYLPREERFGLQSQMRRAAVSVASNIAEGSARRSRLEFIQFLHISRASLAEVETQFLIATHQRLLTDSCALAQIAEVGRLLNGLIRSLGSANRKAHAQACAPLTANR